MTSLCLHAAVLSLVSGFVDDALRNTAPSVNERLLQLVNVAFRFCVMSYSVTRGQSNLTKSASRGAHSAVRGHPRGSKVVPLNSWGRVSY